MSTLQIEAFDHIVINVQNVEASLAFYVDVLGLEGVRVQEFRSGKVSFPSVRVSRDTIIDLFPPKMHGRVDCAGAGNLNHFCLVSAAPITRVHDLMRAAGVTVTNGPTEVFGARGVGISIYCNDPEGNVVEIRTYPKLSC